MTTSFAYGQHRDSGSTLRVRLGRRLKDARQQTRLSLKDVSERMGRSETYYGMIERGQRRPSQGVLLRICEILDMPAADRDAVFRLFRDSYVADSLRGFELQDANLAVRERSPHEPDGDDPAVMRFVLDASVAAKWFTRHVEDDHAAAMDLFDRHRAGRCRLVLPEFGLLEIINAVRYSPRDSEVDTVAALSVLIDLALQIESLNAELTNRAIAVAWRYDIALYDAVYVALAELLQAPLITADEKLVRRTKGHAAVRLLSDFRSD
jgi:predicted nucleic acid-binding protein/DNA-binding XRE family transcriptional regulator